MLPGAYIGAGAGAGSSGPSFSYLQYAGSASNLSTYTFSSQNLGAAAADRYIFAAVMKRDSTSIGAGSITIGGQSGTQLVSNAISILRVQIYIAAVPSGTTGDVVVTAGQTLTSCQIALWRATGLSSTTPVDTATSSAETANVSVDTTAGGFVIAAASGTYLGTSVWTGATERFNEIVETYQNPTGADYYPVISPESPRSITMTFNNIAAAVSMF